MIEIELPVSIMIPRKTKADRKIIINLNTYRNTHYVINNQLKHLYKESLEGVLKGLVLDCPLDLHFILYHPLKKRIDRANVLSVHEKFFCDALTEYGCIIDDNDKFIHSSYYTSEINDTIKVVVNIYTNMAKPTKKVVPPFIQEMIDKKSGKDSTKVVTKVTPKGKTTVAIKKPAIKIVTKVAMKPMAKGKK